MSDEDAFYGDDLGTGETVQLEINLPLLPGTDDLHLNQPETQSKAPSTHIALPLTRQQLREYYESSNPIYTNYVNQIFENIRAQELIRNLTEYGESNSENTALNQICIEQTFGNIRYEELNDILRDYAYGKLKNIALNQIYSQYSIPVIHSVRISPEVAAKREELVATMDAFLQEYNNKMQYYSLKLELARKKSEIFDIVELAEDNEFVTFQKNIIELLTEADELGCGLALCSTHALINMNYVSKLIAKKYLNTEVDEDTRITDATNFLNANASLLNTFKLARWAIGPRSNTRIPNVGAFLEVIQQNLENSSLPISKLTLIPSLEKISIEITSGLFSEMMMEILGNMAKYGAKEGEIVCGYSIDEDSRRQFLLIDFIQKTPNGKLKPSNSSGTGHELIRGMGVRINYTDLTDDHLQVVGGITRVEIPIQVPVEF